MSNCDLVFVIEGYKFALYENPPRIDGCHSECPVDVTLEELRDIHRQLGAYLDTVDIERFKYVYCIMEEPTATIFEYATDVFDNIHTASRWLLRQPADLTMEQIETKLGQIKYGVYG